MIEPELLFKCRCLAEDIAVVEVPCGLELSNEEMKAINAEWRELLKSSKAQGIQLWDSLAYRLENIDEIRSGSMILHLGTFSYSTLRSLIRRLENGQLNQSQYPLGAGCVGLIQTSDGYWILARRSSYVTNPGKVAIIGGSLIKSEKIIASGRDIESALFEEIQEEIGVDSTNIISNYVVGMILSHHANFAVIFETRLDLTKDQVQHQFDRHDCLEMDELVFFTDSQEIQSYRDKNINLDRYLDFFSELFMPTTDF